MSSKSATSSLLRPLAVGLDLGSQKTIVVDETGEIIRTDTGSVSRPTLISFNGKKRLFGEEAFAQISADSTIPLINLMAGRSLDEINTLSCFSHRKIQIVSDAHGRLVAEVKKPSDDEHSTKYYVTMLLAMYLAHLNEQISTVVGGDAVFCFPLYPNYTTNVARAYLDAAAIAGVGRERVFVGDAADALVATYARKITGLGGAEKVGLLGKRTLIVDMGHVQTTIVIAEFSGDNDTPPKKVAVAHDNNLGSFHFDLQLFHHFANVCLSKHSTKIELNSKRGARLLAGCERIRKLLSQLNESKITVEHLIEDSDIHFALKREEMASLCSDLLVRFQALVKSVFQQVSSSASFSAGSQIIHAIEVLGGGVRMPVVQQSLQQSVAAENNYGSANEGTTPEPFPLGAKLDDGSIALGVALLYAKATAPVVDTSPSIEINSSKDASPVMDTDINPVIDESVGFSGAEILAMQDLERQLHNADVEVKAVQGAYNKLESYILDMRSAPRRKFGETIDSVALNAVLDDVEGWLWDNSETTDRQAFEDKFVELDNKIRNELCTVFFERTEEEKRKVEEQLQEESAKAAAEKALNGEEDDDHDNRKLKKADRLRLVNKNKEEGNELFAAGNYRMALARYHKAVTHSTKFFDLGPEDKEEVTNIQVALYNNLATCYSKVENQEQMLRYCEEALKLNPKSLKALFRRSQYYEHKKEFELASQDLKKCQEYNITGNEDKLVTKALERVKKEIQKLKEKEKKMWGKAFG